MAHISKNYPRNKFDILKDGVTEYRDMLMVLETKLEDTFPHAFRII